MSKDYVYLRLGFVKPVLIISKVLSVPFLNVLHIQLHMNQRKQLCDQLVFKTLIHNYSDAVQALQKKRENGIPTSTLALVCGLNTSLDSGFVFLS